MMEVRGVTMKNATGKNDFHLKLVVLILFASLTTLVYGAEDKCVTCVQADLMAELNVIKANISKDLDDILANITDSRCDPNQINHVFFARRGPGLVANHTVDPSTCSTQTRRNYVTFTKETDNTNVNEGSVFNIESGFYTAPVNGTYMFEFHALKAARWNKAAGSDMPTCIVRLVKEVQDFVHNNFTVSTIAEGKVVAMDWYSSFPVQIEAIAKLNEKERIAVRLDDGELQGGFLTTFTGFLIAQDKYDDVCTLNKLD